MQVQAAARRSTRYLEPRFVPGTVLTGRYRIVGLLGEGGMGEVYRADDLKLQEPVALKFLPEGVAEDDSMLARFHQEVRVAHQISHPNVCRVYDIGEVDGQHFISMEYIDGENLASLVRRIGHLPPVKALEIAHQLCAGLAAAHGCGVLHRDLKPGNVMIDGRGRAKITDFGLAGLVDDFQAGDEKGSPAGTPAYMAPEQNAHQKFSVQSDIYSLGLVLFEIFTGQRAFLGSEREAQLEKGLEAVPRSPSSLVEIDPEVERVLLRCLQHDPLERPASVLDLAAALPGGDPLAAALAAGETPSPEMVAAAPRRGTVAPSLAIACLAGFVLELLAVGWLSGQGMLHRRVPLESPPAVLADRALEIVRIAGWEEQIADRAWGLREDRYVMQHLVRQGDPAAGWTALASGRPAAIYFWHRTGPQALVPALHGFWRVDFDDPPLHDGMTRVFLDPMGRLIAFQAVPARQLTGEAEIAPRPVGGDPVADEPDWRRLFAAAELELNAFRPVEPHRTPPFHSDARRAWEGRYTDPDVPVRIEAAALGGRPIWFEVLAPWHRTAAPWTDPIRFQPVPAPPRWRAFEQLLVVLFFAVLGLSIVLARRNLQAGRGDRTGAFRFALCLYLVSMVSWLLWTSHVPLFLELLLFIEASALAIFRCTFFWVLYVALEPYVRRRWPGRIVSWSRLLGGRWRDPLVGRDVLIGALAGAGLLLVVLLGAVAPSWVGHPTDLLSFVDADALVGLPGVVRQVNEHVFVSVVVALASLFMLLLLTMLFEQEWLAVVAFWGLLALVFNLAWSGGAGLLVAWTIVPAVLVFLLRRCGLLTVASAIFVYLTLRYYPITPDLSAWYAESSVWALLVVGGLAVWGFRRSLAGQPLLPRGSLDERISSGRRLSGGS